MEKELLSDSRNAVQSNAKEGVGKGRGVVSEAAVANLLLIRCSFGHQPHSLKVVAR